MTVETTSVSIVRTSLMATEVLMTAWSRLTLGSLPEPGETLTLVGRIVMLLSERVDSDASGPVRPSTRALRPSVTGGRVGKASLLL